MYAFGDVADPDPESIAALDDILQNYIIDIVSYNLAFSLPEILGRRACATIFKSYANGPSAMKQLEWRVRQTVPKSR